MSTEAEFLKWLDNFNRCLDDFQHLRPRAASHLQLEHEVREANRDLKAAIEVIAEGIYYEWKGDPLMGPEWVPWVRRGNSLKQDEARGQARKLIADARAVTR